MEILYIDNTVFDLTYVPNRNDILYEYYYSLNELNDSD